MKPLALSLVALSLLLPSCDARKDLPAPGVSAATLEVAKSLLRGELAATTTYGDVIKRNDRPEWTAEMRTILGHHENAVTKLRARVVALGGDVDSGGGAWGAWTDLAAKGAALLGDEPGRAVLEAGESKGVNDYERALENANADDVTKALVRGELLERTRANVATLKALKK